MIEEVPKFDNVKIALIAKQLFNIEGVITELVSFEDQNALITGSKSRYVFKIANKRWPVEFLNMQHQVMDYLAITLPDLSFSKPIISSEGSSLLTIDGFTVRILSFLEGEIFANVEKSADLYHDAGQFLGRFSTAMQGYTHPAAHRDDDFWNLDNVISCKVYLDEVDNLDTRDRIDRLFKVYEKDIMPVVKGLRKAVIHGDANEQNYLVNKVNVNKIAGLIDFGEMIYASQVNDLAIALAYLLLGEEDTEMASAQIITGYCKEFPLNDDELSIIYYLAAMRLVTNITMTSHEAKKHPDNTYILISQGAACILLKKLEDEGYILSKDTNTQSMRN